MLTKTQRRDWTFQYQQGESQEKFPGLGCGNCPLITPRVTFFSPFAESGHLEVNSGLGKGGHGDGTGSIRLCRGDVLDPALCDIFLIPMQHVEQVIITSNPNAESEDVLRVIIVPTGATGASGLTRELPQIIHFDWPNRKADEGLRGTVLDKLNTEDATYLSILKTILDKELAPFGKEVIVHTGGQTPNNSPYPRFTARFARGDAGPSTKAPKGIISFLPTGLLWFSQTILYLPLTSFNLIDLVFIRDIASSTPQDSQPIVAVYMMCRVSEPFYEARGERPPSKLVLFKDLGERSTSPGQIQSYCEAHGIGFTALEQIFYDYAENQRATGFMPLMNS